MSRNTGGWAIAGMVMLALLAGTVQAGGGAKSEPGFLEARQYHIGPATALIPNGSTGRQILDCWQVTSGKWNGQILDGLSLVLVRELSEDGTESRINVYVSSVASAAQRDALMAALAVSYPGMFPNRLTSGLQIEPAVIELEQTDGQSYILHLGLIA